jgi:hypothetical protein
MPTAAAAVSMLLIFFMLVFFATLIALQPQTNLCGPGTSTLIPSEPFCFLRPLPFVRRWWVELTHEATPGRSKNLKVWFPKTGQDPGRRISNVIAP